MRVLALLHMSQVLHTSALGSGKREWVGRAIRSADVSSLSVGLWILRACLQFTVYSLQFSDVVRSIASLPNCMVTHTQDITLQARASLVRSAHSLTGRLQSAYARAAHADRAGTTNNVPDAQDTRSAQPRPKRPPCAPGTLIHRHSRQRLRVHKGYIFCVRHRTHDLLERPARTMSSPHCASVCALLKNYAVQSILSPGNLPKYGNFCGTQRTP